MSILHKEHKIDEAEIRFKFLSDSVLKAFEKDGRKFCRLTASSNAEDLVGDVMSQKALEQMKSSAATRFWIWDFGFWIGRTRNDRSLNREIRNRKSAIPNAWAVLVRDKSPNPKRSKGIIIEEVEYIETSIVGVPCMTDPTYILLCLPLSWLIGWIIRSRVLNKQPTSP